MSFARDAIRQGCPSCYSPDMWVFYELKQIPVNSMLLLSTREDAIDFPTGDLALGFCKSCGFMSNIAFDSNLLEYSSRYEATQGFSHTFSTFQRNLATRLVERFRLYDKKIIEIGCGQGEFLTLICELGGNRGVGFDPCYRAEPKHNDNEDRITFIKDFYSEKYTACQGDFFCCKMTLEHIPNTFDFVAMVRRSIIRSGSPIVLFQVPDTTRVLREVAFWDLYYEHCSYFTAGSLAHLFRRCGFDIIELAMDFDDQYLMIVARPGSAEAFSLTREADLETVAQDVDYFSANYRKNVAAWQQYLADLCQSGQHVVVWGAGSKAVAFLTTLNARREIQYAVDINPHKQGTYLAGAGVKIVGPGFLHEYQPEVVIVMNPIYCSEITNTLTQIGIRPEVVPLNTNLSSLIRSNRH
jgi:hypothetical protein